MSFSGAALAVTAADPSLSVTVTPSTSQDNGLMVVSFGPVT
jgi:hypothetical protein